jgi:hypothetical protein
MMRLTPNPLSKNGKRKYPSQKVSYIIIAWVNPIRESKPIAKMSQ